MAQQPQPQYDFHYQNVELIKTESLGIGSYGAVCKAMCDDLPCAAKILHPALFQFTTPGTTSVMQKFEQECRLLSAIKHPHIVQYLGTYCDPESRLPVLLMELMDESLTHFLERAKEPLPYHTEVNLCHDISLALSYLHSNGIVHRDLSSNNVLLIAGSRAKVTDFGMVKLYDVNRSTAHLTPLTLCPGTVAYMSPEALGEPPVYTEKLDSFSLGVLGIQIMTRQFPDPGNRFQVIEIRDPRIPSGRVQVELAEVERRQSHISLINPDHPLLSVALDCLKDQDRKRPSCHELCGCISTLKTSPMYTESVQQSRVRTEPAQSDQTNREREVLHSHQIQDLQQQIRDLQQQLQEQQLENQQQQQQILGLRVLLTTNNDQLQNLQQQLTSKDEQLAGKEHQLQQKEAAIASIKLRWKDGRRAPHKLCGEVCAVNGSVAYFLSGEDTVLAYESAKNNWSELPGCPTSDFSLAVINNLLTAIGGKTPNGEYTSSLLSHTGRKWTGCFPPMPTKRWLTAVVCSGRSLVVAGGTGEGYKKLSTVEVMDTETLQWSTASSLPHPLYQATATLCGDQVYVLGGFDESDESSKSVFTCSLAALLQSKSGSLGARMKTLSLASGPNVWQQLADTPLTLSTCASLHGQLLAVGGTDSDEKQTTAIHMYNMTTYSWEVISHMATPRSQCLVAVLPHNELMAVGGFAAPAELTDSVEISTIV